MKSDIIKKISKAKTSITLIAISLLLLTIISGCQLSKSGRGAYIPGGSEKQTVSNTIDYIKENDAPPFTIVVSDTASPEEIQAAALFAAYLGLKSEDAAKLASEVGTDETNLIIFGVDSDNSLTNNLLAGACTSLQCDATPLSIVNATQTNNGVNLIIEAKNKEALLYAVQTLIYVKNSGSTRNILGYESLEIHKTENNERDVNPFGTCIDKTFYNTCSIEKPLFCDAETTTLIDKAAVCGCPAGKDIDGETCVLCVEEGNSIPIIPNPPKCCEGLQEIDLKKAIVPPVGVSGICTAKCGNGVCDAETEDYYNCNADCASTCKKEGETISSAADPPCCPGLEKISPATPTQTEDVGDGAGICAPIKLECTDSDDGKIYGVKGTTTQGELIVTDYCSSDGKTLYEHYCDEQGNLVQNFEYACPEKCVDGACVQKIIDPPAKVETASNFLSYGEPLNDVKPVFTKTELPNLLADGTVTDKTGNSYAYDAEIYSGTQKVQFGNTVPETTDPILYLDSSATNQVYNVTINFPTPLNQSTFYDGGAGGSTINLFGNEYVLSNIPSDIKSDKIVLYSVPLKYVFVQETCDLSQDKVIHFEKTATFKIDEKEHTLKVIEYDTDSNSVAIEVNGQSANIGQDLATTVGDLKIYPFAVYAHTQPTCGAGIILFLGVNKLIFADGQQVEKSGGQYIDGTHAGIKSVDGKISQIYYEVTPVSMSPQKKFLKENEELVDPVFGAFKWSFTGATIPNLNDESIILQPETKYNVFLAPAEQVISTQPSTVCTDSDVTAEFPDGKNYDLKGIIYAEGSIQGTDSCTMSNANPFIATSDGKYLLEFFCDLGKANKLSYHCAYGCKDGACLPASTQSIDFNLTGVSKSSFQEKGAPTEGKKDFGLMLNINYTGKTMASKHVKTTVTVQDLNKKLISSCYMDLSANWVDKTGYTLGAPCVLDLPAGKYIFKFKLDTDSQYREVDENNNNYTQIIEILPKDFLCTDGEKQQQLNGRDSFVKGTTIGWDTETFLKKTFQDECADEKHVKKYYCAYTEKNGIKTYSNTVSSTVMFCRNGCLGGACAAETYPDVLIEQDISGFKYSFSEKDKLSDYYAIYNYSQYKSKEEYYLVQVVVQNTLHSKQELAWLLEQSAPLFDDPRSLTKYKDNYFLYTNFNAPNFPKQSNPEAVWVNGNKIISATLAINPKTSELMFPFEIVDAYLEKYSSDLNEEAIATPVCIDSDKGKDYYTKGTLYLNGEKKETDSCLLDSQNIAPQSRTDQGQYLLKFFCEADAAKNEIYFCAYGCKDGACLSAPDELSASFFDIPTPSASTDLKPVELKIFPENPIEGDILYFNLTLTKTGYPDINALSINVTYVKPNDKIESKKELTKEAIAELNANGIYTLQIQQSTAEKPGAYTMKILLDPEDKITEADKTNNRIESSANVRKIDVFQKKLEKNWNLVAVPLTLRINKTSEIFKNAKKIDVYEYDPNLPNKWKVWHSDPNVPGDLTELEKSKAYLINSAEATTITFTGVIDTQADLQSEVQLKPGWNLIGFYSLNSKPAAQAFAQISGKYNSIITYDKGITKTIGATDLVLPGVGYWVYMNEEGEITK